VSDDRQTTQEQARAEEIRAEVAVTDARRADEEVARQHDEVEEASKKEEKLAAKEREAAAKAERATAEAAAAREQAAPATRAQTLRTSAQAAIAGLPGVDRLPPGAQRPEVLVGAAFGGAFVLARVLKHFFD
jgi:chemotaxis response regulator CheB